MQDLCFEGAETAKCLHAALQPVMWVCL